MRSDLCGNIAIFGAARPAVKSAIGDAIQNRSFRARDGRPEGIDVAAVAPVDRLFGVGRPPAVFFLVANVGIYSVDGVLVAAWPHVFQELLKRLKPLGADRYASASVVFVGGMAKVDAPLNHAVPTHVLWTFLPRRMSVPHIGGWPLWAGTICLQKKASAASRSIFVGEEPCFHHSLLSAVAVAHPPESIAGLQRWELDPGHQSAKSLPSEIAYCHGVSVSQHAADARLLHQSQ